MIKSMALVAVFLGLLPFLLGLFYTGFVEKEKNNILLNMAAGYVIMFGIFEVVVLPLIWMRQSLSLLIAIYGGILLLLALVSLVLNYRRILGIVTGAFQAVPHFNLCIWLLLLLIAGQLFVYTRYEYSNADDSFYVAAATTALSTDTILERNPYTGSVYESLPSRYVLSPFFVFNAVCSRVTCTHPAIMAHSVFMILFLILAYAVYALIGRILFDGDMEKVGYFLLILAGLLVFSSYSERTSGRFLLIRLWQGKAILAGILLPMLLYLAFRLFDGRRADYVLLFALMCACCMVSSMGVALGAIMLGITGILLAWRKKSLRMLCCLALCGLPNLICAGIYFVIR